MTGQHPQLPQGQAVRLAASGTTAVVGSALGSGGQGTVYLCDVGGRRLALKWYHPDTVRRDATLRGRIDRLVALGPPDRRYLWPLDRAEIPGRAEFGYVMPLVSDDRRPLKDILARPPQRLALTLEARAVACFEVADSFLQLHAKGLCFQDVNFGAFFVDPVRGSVLICDADNISIEGQLGGVYGTRKFMAPEVVRREAIPSMRTDLYSMAVLFFYVLFNWHPLDGKREADADVLDAATEARLYGTRPLFLFDPSDPSNGPVPGLHDWVAWRWRAMPRALRELFGRVFAAGLGPEQRVVETEWLRAFARLKDAVLQCQNCGFEAALDVEAEADGPPCSACGCTVLRPTRMRLPDQFVALLPGSELFRHHVEPGLAPTLGEPVGRMERHPGDAAIVGLHNLSRIAWNGRLRDGAAMNVGPGRTIRVVDGLEIDFGRRRGLVVGADHAAEGAP